MTNSCLWHQIVIYEISLGSAVVLSPSFILHARNIHIFILWTEKSRSWCFLRSPEALPAPGWRSPVPSASPHTMCSRLQHPWSPPLDSLQVIVFPVTQLYAWMPCCRRALMSVKLKGHNHLPPSTGSVPADTAQCAASLHLIGTFEEFYILCYVHLSLFHRRGYSVSVDFQECHVFIICT